MRAVLLDDVLTQGPPAIRIPERLQVEIVLAQIQARFGDHDTAIAALPHLLEVPAGLKIADLKLDPLWDPVRNDPRFQKLCQEPNK